MTYLSKYLLLLFAAFGVLETSAQKTHAEYKKDLKSLDGGKYIAYAFDAAEDLSGKGEYKNALDIVERAVKKAKPMGDGTRVVVYANKTKLIARRFPKDDKYVNELLDSYDEMLKRKPPINIEKEVIELLSSIRSRASGKMQKELDKRIKDHNERQNKKQQDLASGEMEDKLKEFKKKVNKEEAFLEIEKLKSERERLEELQSKLSQTVDRSEALLIRRSQVINNMSRDKVKREALVQYNQRMIDSLRFIAQIDSFSLVTQKRQIVEQESQLALQESEIQLQASTLQLQESELQLKSSRQKLFTALSVLGLMIASFLAWLFYSAKKTNRQLELKNEEIEREKERSEELLLNILPKFIAQELKDHQKVKTRMIDSCTVLFTDFINFSDISTKLSPQELIGALDECFRAFDNIISDNNIEKIKTIGDSYMCAGGVPRANDTHAVDAVNAAFEMVAFLDQWNAERELEGKVRFDARIGIHSGPIIAGVVGVKKFAYDIWGDTVNVAARLEGKSSAQKINISSSTFHLIKDHYQCSKRGSISVKNMKDLEMYYVDQKINPAVLN